MALLNEMNGQEKPDSTVLLGEVTVNAYEQNRQIRDVAAPVAIINNKQLNRYGQQSILPAVNATPGVRMEERSPGSYRFNIRGSSLRSPFGVRNVKIYLDGIPFTDPAGGSYLNQLSFFDVTDMEILKGPGSSLYGAGTGGVLLINSMPDSLDHSLLVNYSGGSFNTHNLHTSLGWANKGFQNKLSYTRQSSDGYRRQSAMRRDIASWQGRIKSNDIYSLSANLLYGDLFYETPGGLNETQFNANPRAARPATAVFPGAEDNKASIYQKTFRIGLQQQYQLDGHIKNISSLYGAFSRISNSAILNYERRLEPHFGGRTSFHYTTILSGISLDIVAGAEFQQGYFNIHVYDNEAGQPGASRTDDEINNRQWGLFSQVSAVFKGGWIATAGISLNKIDIRFQRFSEVPSFRYNTSFNNEWAPRISLLKKITGQLSFYGVVSKGFSPPTVSELLPSTTVINTGLEAEQGINYEAGLRGHFLKNRFYADLNLFNFNLKNAITQRRDLSGADYFLNAGDTRQQGIESHVSYRLIRHDQGFISDASLWMSYTFNYFRYRAFTQLDNDYSGNRIPGVAPHTLAGGLDLQSRPGIYMSLTYFYSDPIELNDANTARARSYQLPGFRAGYRKRWAGHFTTDLFFSGDNLLNETYSLGNDINAAAGRYFNAAAGVNYQAGLQIKL